MINEKYTHLNNICFINLENPIKIVTKFYVKNFSELTFV